MVAKNIGAESRSRRVDSILDEVYTRMGALLTTWRTDTRLRADHLESLESAATLALANYTKGDSIVPARRALALWEGAMVQALLPPVDENRCATCGCRRPILVVDVDGKRECSRCMQGYHKLIVGG
jgi:hypothetical protein